MQCSLKIRRSFLFEISSPYTREGCAYSVESGPSNLHIWSSEWMAFISFGCCRYWWAHMSDVMVAGRALYVSFSARSANMGSPWIENNVSKENMDSTTVHSSVPLKKKYIIMIILAYRFKLSPSKYRYGYKGKKMGDNSATNLPVFSHLSLQIFVILCSFSVVIFYIIAILYTINLSAFSKYYAMSIKHWQN